MTNSLADLEDAACFLVVGSNVTETYPVVACRMRRALRRGARLLVVDPRRTELAAAADLHLRVVPGTDVALLNAMAHVIVEGGLHDRAFVGARTESFEDLARAVATWTPERAAQVTGVAAAEIRRAAEIYATTKPAAIIYSMGVTQQAGGTATVLALANLALLTGNVGQRGSGINPLRGQCNVQGCCDMGVLPDFLPGYRPVVDAGARGVFSRAWGVAVPGRPGLRATDLPSAIEAGAIRALYVMGENPLVTHADLGRLEDVLEKLDFLVVQDIFLTETAQRADVVLPAAALAEKDGTVTSTERRVQLVRRAVKPPGRSRSDLRIICDLAARLGSPLGPASPAKVMREIATLVPAYGGISYTRLAGEGLQWPCPEKDHPGTPVLHTDAFPRGRARFTAVRYVPPAEAPSPEFPFVLITGRNLYQYHSGSLTRRTGLNALAPLPYVEINPLAAARLGVVDGEPVRLTSLRGSVEAIARLSEAVRDGELFMPFHYGEAAANRLTGAALDSQAGTPAFKVSCVRVEKARCGRP